jgi:hypothetical protein
MAVLPAWRQRVIGFAAGVVPGFGAGAPGNGLITGADVGLAPGVIPNGWPGLAAGADVPGGRVAPAGTPVVEVPPPGFAAGAVNAGVAVVIRTGAPLAPLLAVPGFGAGARLRGGGVGVGGSGGATSLGGAAWDGADGRCCAG